MNTLRIMNTDSLRAHVPSAYAERPYHNVSNRYEYIPTYPLIEALQKQGWEPIKAYESRTRLADKRGYTKHLIRFVNPDLKLPSVGDTFQALVLTNAHDATAAYHLFAGLFRLVCYNGMVTERRDKRETMISIRHSAKAIAELEQAHSRILLGAKQTSEEVERFNAIDLTTSEQLVYARSALELRWPSVEHENGALLPSAPITPNQLLYTHRFEDRQRPTMWQTLNIVQENLLEGGLPGHTATGGRTTTRAVKSVDGDVRLNRALWRLAQEMSALKVAATA